MAKTQEEFVNLGENSRLVKMTVKNFRCIGPDPIEIDLDDIVVLVGPNNVGKSSIIAAYSIIMNDGSKNGELSIDDFHKRNTENHVVIELHTEINHEEPGSNWIDSSSGKKIIKERWTWTCPGKGKRQGYDVKKGDWDDKVPWGAPNVANSRRPLPLYIDPFASPTEQKDAVVKLLTGILTGKVNDLLSKSDNKDIASLTTAIKTLQSDIQKEAEHAIKQVEGQLSDEIGSVFPNHVIEFDLKTDEFDLSKSLSFFKNSPDLLIGVKDDFMSSVQNQGSGVRRSLMWSALKLVENRKERKVVRPYVLLMDEPEICLHPTAIRNASKLLYEIASNDDWQVIITTHSPIFINLSQDHTTIIRVASSNESAIESVTLFRSESSKLTEDDKKNLKLLNMCDPYINEFFFSGNVIIVEGDTEYSVLNRIIMDYPDEFTDVHIIRARGKGTIVSLVKVLSHFKKGFAILHDSDSPQSKNGNANPAWTLNKRILEAVNQVDRNKVPIRLLATKRNFEYAFFQSECKFDKPYNAIEVIKDDKDVALKVKALLTSLVDFSASAPDCVIEWTDIDQLSNFI